MFGPGMKLLAKLALAGVAVAFFAPLDVVPRYVGAKYDAFHEWLRGHEEDRSVIDEAQREVARLPIADFALRVSEMEQQYEASRTAHEAALATAARERTAIARGRELLAGGRELFVDRAGHAFSRNEVERDLAAREATLSREEAKLAMTVAWLGDFRSELATARDELARMEECQQSARHEIDVKATRLLHLRMLESLRGLNDELKVLGDPPESSASELDRRIARCEIELGVGPARLDLEELVAAGGR